MKKKLVYDDGDDLVIIARHRPEMEAIAREMERKWKAMEVQININSTKFMKIGSYEPMGLLQMQLLLQETEIK